MSKRIVLLALTVIFLLTGTEVMADTGNETELQASHNILLQGMTWRAYSVDCLEDEKLSGSFQVTCDGSLYPGDEKKYDDWSLEGIQFFIVDEDNYQLFLEGEPFEVAFERNDVLKLSWIFEVPHKGVWFIIYNNNTIYMMTVEGSILHPSESLNFLVVCIVIGLLVASIGLVMKIKNESHG